MNIENTLAQLKEHEGFSAEVYKDHLGIDTVGYGFTIKDLQLPEGVSSTILRIIVLNRVIDLHNRFAWFSLMPPEIQGVIVEMSYQLGIEGFAKFKKTVYHLKHRQWKEASKEMLRSQWAEKQTPGRAKKLSEIVRKVG